MGVCLLTTLSSAVKPLVWAGARKPIKHVTYLTDRPCIASRAPDLQQRLLAAAFTARNLADLARAFSLIWRCEVDLILGLITV
jgi:hypothetical protein